MAGRKDGQQSSVVLIVYLFLMVGALVSLGPFIWMILTSLKPSNEVLVYPPRLFPSRWMWGNYIAAWQSADFGLYFRNSLVYMVFGTLGCLIISSLAGFGFARHEFAGRDLMMALVVGTMMIPLQVRLIPLFIMMKNVPFAGGNNWLGQGGTGLHDTFAGLILPTTASGFGIFLFRQFFLTLPRELEDAARIDGCSEFEIYWRIFVPLAKPAFAVLSIFCAQWTWNDFLWPLVITMSKDMRTVQIGLQTFRQENVILWEMLMAATVISTIPLIIIFLLGQRYFEQGIAFSGIKG